MARHSAYWSSTHSRKAIFSKIANAAAAGRIPGRGILGGVLSGRDADGIFDQFRLSLFPILPALAHVLLRTIVKMTVECCIRMAQNYLDWGCGPWLLLGCWNTLYQAVPPPEYVNGACALPPPPALLYSPVI